MISSTHKFVFIDIAKAAGTAIGEVLKNYGGVGKHHSVSRALPQIQENHSLESPLNIEVLDDYFCFTFVRNPYDRLLSLYSYCRDAPLQRRFSKEQWDALSGPAHSPAPEKAIDRRTYWPEEFSTFLDWLISHDDYFCDFTGEKYIPMTDWLVDGSGDLRVDFVGKYERLQTDFDVVMNRIGAPTTSLPVKNVSPDQYKSEARRVIEASPVIQERIKEYFREDFERFGYSPHIDDLSLSG